MQFKVERDSLGEMQIDASKYWGAQTERSLRNFKIGTEKMPQEIIYAFAILKKSAAITNNQMGKLGDEKCETIKNVCDEIISGKLDEHFPLAVWQTGSGTQSNMNINEVIANRGNEIANKKLLHQNDDVNMSQSSNDTFPTAMHIAAVIAIENSLLPSIELLRKSFESLEIANQEVIKIGRTHLQDATPIKFSQEISGWRYMLQKNYEMINDGVNKLRQIALGGTAVGTGLNAPKGFDIAVSKNISLLSGKQFETSPNKFHALTSLDALVFAHGSLKALAADMMKIANDIRWLSSGPRCGLDEILIPANEPGSSIMPGKVNPTQCEAVTMVAVQVMANDVAVGFSASQGNFELNVFLPVSIYNFLQSVRLLSDALISFNNNCVVGIKANTERMNFYLENSLMLVTALNPYIGYDNSAKAAKTAFENNTSLKEAVLSLSLLSEEQFEKAVDPTKMI